MAARSTKKGKPSSSGKRKPSLVAEAPGDQLREGFDQLRAQVGEKFEQLRAQVREEFQAQERR